MSKDHSFPQAVLFDRDATLIHDVPYNGDPDLVRPMPGALRVLAALRAASVRCAVVSNQSGIGRGLLTAGQVHAVNQRVQQLLGPFDAVCFCPHSPEERCDCRKPAPGLLLQACSELGVEPEQAAMVGDIGADIAAGHAAGMRAVLVPTPATRREEIDRAPLVASDLAEAMQLLGGIPGPVHRLEAAQ